MTDDEAGPLEENHSPHERVWSAPGVLSVGAASFFSDSGHELTTSLLPTFITSSLHAGPGALALIDGVADALAGLSKLAGGSLAADPARRGRLASGGYLFTAIATAAIGAATAIWQVAILRAVAWLARGIRSPARDALLVDLAPARARGRAFGVERAGDNAGAICGPLLASGLVAVIGIRQAIWFSIIPGVLAGVAITIAAGQARHRLSAHGGRRHLRLHLRSLHDAGLTWALVPVALFEFGNLAVALLILRVSEQLTTTHMSARQATSLAILLYAGHNGAAALTSVVAGWSSDHIGPRTVLGVAAGTYVLGYGVFAVGPAGIVPLAGAFLLAGAGIGLAETGESALVAAILPEHLRAHGFGVLGLLQSFGDLGATVVAGLLWATLSATVAFLYALSWMAACLLVLILRPVIGPAGSPQAR